MSHANSNLSVPKVIVSADWSKHPKKRTVHVAEVDTRRVAEVRRSAWTFDELLAEARRHKGRGSVLIAMDLALGVPAGFWRAVKADPRWAQCGSFLEWLAIVGAESSFFDPVADPKNWSLDRPFFRVQEGEGGLNRYTALVGGGMLRRIDRATQAKPIFAASGIPGTVGSATASLWRELVPLLNQERDFAVWPFESDDRSIRLVESYPGLAYGAGFAAALPAARLRVAKTNRDVRAVYCDRLEASRWVAEHGVGLGDLSRARADEDVFDSLVTAASILRCILEDRSLCAAEWVDAEAEGTMVLAGPVDPSLPFQDLRVARAAGEVRRTARTMPRAGDTIRHPCPIPGCDKVFVGGRGGWDAHVASPRFHREWNPHITDDAERKARFRLEFPGWFD